MEVTIIKKYGVVHLKNALNISEQETLFKEVKGNVRGVGTYPGVFHASSGEKRKVPLCFASSFLCHQYIDTNIPELASLFAGAAGAPHRNEMLHNLGELLFTRSAEAVVSELDAVEIAAEPSLKRLGDAATGENPPNVNNVTGASYKPGATMNNHCDLDRPLYTMSVAVGCSCEFTVGKVRETLTRLPNQTLTSSRLAR